MTKWLHLSSNLSVLRLSPDMGEYNSPQIKQWFVKTAHLGISYVKDLAEKCTVSEKIEYGSLATIYVITTLNGKLNNQHATFQDSNNLWFLALTYAMANESM